MPIYMPYAKKSCTEKEIKYKKKKTLNELNLRLAIVEDQTKFGLKSDLNSNTELCWNQP